MKKILSAFGFIVILIAIAIGRDIGKHVGNKATSSSELSPQKIDVYEFARIGAQQANAELHKGLPNDGVTVSAKAYADDKAIVYENILAIRRDVTESDLKVWRSGTRSEIVPQACLLLKQTPFFNQGFHFHYRYFDREGRVLDDFLVNRPACEGI